MFRSFLSLFTLFMEGEEGWFSQQQKNIPDEVKGTKKTKKHFFGKFRKSMIVSKKMTKIKK